VTGSRRENDLPMHRILAIDDVTELFHTSLTTPAELAGLARTIAQQRLALSGNPRANVRWALALGFELGVLIKTEGSAQAMAVERVVEQLDAAIADQLRLRAVPPTDPS
jgi:hypothetical protein